MFDLIIIKNKEFKVSVALTKEEQAKGLMFEYKPKPMIFPYQQAEVRKFWMENTLFPLDILFCKNGQIIDIVQGKPFNKDSVGPDKPSDMVIELPYGTVLKEGIVVGDGVRIKYSIATLAKKYQLEKFA